MLLNHKQRTVLYVDGLRRIRIWSYESYYEITVYTSDDFLKSDWPAILDLPESGINEYA